MLTSAKLKEKDAIINQIKEYSPYFKNFFNLDISLEQYSRDIFDFPHNEIYVKRQELIKEKIEEKFKSLFGSEFDGLNLNLEGQLACNIVDHHMVLNHPLLISSNVITGVEKFFQKKKPAATVVISSGDVPPNNYFGKNGFQFNDKKIPIFTNKEKEFNSNLLDLRKFDFIDNLKLSKQWGLFNDNEQNFLTNETSFINQLDFSKCNNYLDQITVINKNTWPRLFENKLRENLFDLLYISQEELTSLCLVGLLMEDNLVSYSLFDENFRDRILKEFDDTVVTWNEKEKKGTHFFWRKHPDQPKSLRLYFKDGFLIPEDTRFLDLKFKLDRDNVIELLRKKEIYPSLFTIFLTLNFYAGIKPLVGQGSLTYLNVIRDLWLKILEKSDYKNEINNISSFKIDKLIAGIAIFFENNNDVYRTLWAYDIIAKGGISETYLRNLFKMPFKDLLSTSIVGIYDYIAQKYIPEKLKIIPTLKYEELASLVFEQK